MTRAVANHLGLQPKPSSAASAGMRDALLQPTQQQLITPETQSMEMQPMDMRLMPEAQPKPCVTPKEVATENAAEAFLVQSLSEVLANAKLSQYEEALRDLGCAELDDLRNMEEADFVEIGMKKVLSTQFTRDHTLLPPRPDVLTRTAATTMMWFSLAPVRLAECGCWCGSACRSKRSGSFELLQADVATIALTSWKILT